MLLGTVLRVIYPESIFSRFHRANTIDFVCYIGGIDLAGIFPLYINIRRGAIITVVCAWICQPWQLVNRAPTFLSVISSFSVFLAPIMGVMIADFFFVRKMRLKLSELYKSHGDFWYFRGVNWRAFPAWVVGSAPTIGGLVLTSNPKLSGPRVLYQLYFVAFFYGTLQFTFSLGILTHFPRFLLQPAGLLPHKPGIPGLSCWRYG
jgi:cytosine/uracil/thiamine/allantoin permease